MINSYLFYGSANSTINDEQGFGIFPFDDVLVAYDNNYIFLLRFLARYLPLHNRVWLWSTYAYVYVDIGQCWLS